MEGTLKDIERRMITEIIIKHPNWNLDSFGFWISPIFFVHGCTASRTKAPISFAS
jgi:hypothetical protein